MKSQKYYIFLLLFMLMGAMLSDIASPVPFDTSTNSEKTVEKSSSEKTAEQMADDNLILTSPRACLKNESQTLNRVPLLLSPSTDAIYEFFRPPITLLS